MEFLEEIQTLTKTYNSPKLERVKDLIRKAASNGEVKLNLDYEDYDRWVLNWLTAQGFTIKTTFDQRERDFTTVSWDVN